MFRTSTKLACAFGLLAAWTGAFAQFTTGEGIVSKPAWESFKLNPKTRVKLDFRNANIDLVIAFISRTSGITIVKDPTLVGPITVTSAKAVPLSEAFDILNSVLSLKGFDMRKEGQHLVVRAQRQRGGGGRTGDVTGGNQPGGGMTFPTMPDTPQTELKVYPIQYANASQVARVINDVFAGMQGNNPFQAIMQLQQMQQAGRGGRGGMRGGFGGRGFGNSGGSVRASADDYSNSVIVNAATKDQEQVSDLIKQIDKQSDTPQQSKVYKLQYASAVDLQSIVQNVLTANAPKGRGGASSNQQGGGPGGFFGMLFRGNQAGTGSVIAEARTNSLVVTATEENLKLLDNVVKELDKPIEYADTTFVFTLNNARADLVAPLLQQAFGGRSGSGFGAGSGFGRTTSTGNTLTNRNNANSRGTGGGNTRPGTGLGGSTSGGQADNSDATRAMDLALQDPNQDQGDLLTQISIQGGFGGMFGGQQRRTTAQTTSTDAAGRLVNIRDMAGEVTVIADPNTNSLIIVTLPENVELLKKILAQLDKIPEQVMIETIIVEATLDASSKFGVEWQFVENNLAGDKGNTGTFGSDFGLKNQQPPAQGFKYTMSGGKLTSFMNMLQTDQKFRVLSTPRIFTANNSQAQINISQSIPYVLSQREDANGNLTFNYAFQDVGIVLTVTPHITQDGFVTMDVTQTANDLQGYTSFNAPIVNQRQANTSVAVKDGETIILGGIIRNTVTATTNKIPLLGDIPILGNLFKSTSKENVKTELLVFLTPRIVRDAAEAKKLKDDQQKQLSDETQKLLKKQIPPPAKADGKDQGNGNKKGGSSNGDQG